MMTRHAGQSLAVFVCLTVALGAAPSTLHAQWVATLTPTVNPLAIGGCGPVRLTLTDPVTKSWPRNPVGNYVALSDFDLSVVGVDPTGVAGEYNGPSIWSACACQGATVGSTATVTATYPAALLGTKQRVPGVAFQATATFTIAKPRAASDVLACQALKSPGAVATGRTAPTGMTGSPTPPGTSGSLPTPVGTQPRSSPIASAAPAPTGVTVSGIAPLVASLTWNAMPNAQQYAVWRASGNGSSINRTPTALSGTQFIDTVPDPSLTYQYFVEARYANGLSAQSPAVTFTSPPLVNPSGFTVTDMSLVRNIGGVDFKWNAVPGAVKYRITGTGLASTGVFAQGTAMAVGNTPSGSASWKLVTLYAGNVSDSTTASVASLVVRRLPPHSTPWLSHRNGVGALLQVQTPAHQVLNTSTGGSSSGRPSSDLFPTFDPNYVTWLGTPYEWTEFVDYTTSSFFFAPKDPAEQNAECNPGDDVFKMHQGGSAATQVGYHVGCYRAGLKLWLDTTSPLWDDSLAAPIEAVYGNAGDLGVGRRSYCEQRPRGPPYAVGLYTVCYATAHGPTPGQPGFNDPQTITNPQPGIGSDFILSMVITKDASGTVFLVLGKNGKYNLLSTVGLDTEGPKIVPFACISCHGGTYNATTRKVDGASFLPLDPELLTFASAADQSAQEEKLRKMNAMIVNSDPTSAIASYLRGLYGNAVNVPGTRATPDYVPQSWAAQAGFYRQIVRPYCMTCHLAAPTSWNFASWGNFQSNAPLIRADVCNAHTMPHSELQYKAFWTKNTGALYLPGLLAATLGFPSC